MGEPASYVSSSHTVAELKVMCKENGLSTSGRKAELIARLDAHFSEDSISLEETISLEEPELISLEESESVPLPKVDEEEILVAEVIEADLIEEVEEITPTSAKDKAGNVTLVEQIKNPKVAAILLTILLATGGWYWYVSNQLQPFTADDLRYGDSMEYTLLNGDLDATGEYVELVRDNVDSEELNESCRLQLTFSGTGTTSVTNGGSSELDFEPDDSLIGVVQAKGAYGLDWLAVEKVQTRNFDTFSVSRYLPKPLQPDECMSQSTGGLGGTLEFNTKTWTEISERDVISSQADWKLNLDGEYTQGTTVSYGLGGILGLLEDIAPGFAIVVSPVELREMMGTQLIDTGTNGTHLGWDWNVIGPDEIGDEEMWKVSMENSQIRDNCFGHARITMWIIEDSPWAVKQNVDVQISGDEGDKSACGTVTKELADLVLPEGRLSLSLEMSKNSLTRGEKLLDLGRSYTSVPNAGAYVPTTDELIDWGDNELHMPDNSSLRSENLEDAVGCLTSGHVSEAVAANSALNDDGYIWRARDDRSSDNGTTRWNLSWVSSDPNSGWVEIDVAGNPSSANCTYIAHGGHDESVAHSRDDIPEVLSLQVIEEDLTDVMRFSILTGDDGFFTASGEYHPETRVGILVVTPDSEYTDWLNQLNSGDTGATTIDITRSWTSTSGGVDWDNSLSLAMNANTGQVVGWNLVQSPI
ncbi:MAG: SAP domain-containing protein [Candidatus Poseidoniales archaeon]|nr:SAP domain-containing protein [Candidatus Poseidoniales archaeon]